MTIELANFVLKRKLHFVKTRGHASCCFPFKKIASISSETSKIGVEAVLAYLALANWKFSSGAI